MKRALYAEKCCNALFLQETDIIEKTFFIFVFPNIILKCKIKLYHEELSHSDCNVL